MKLSFKFFFMAYIIVLLSAGSGGIFLVNNITSTSWNIRREQVVSSAKYAYDSFCSFYDINIGTLTEKQTGTISRQIKDMLDSSVTQLEIFTEKTADSEYIGLQENKGILRFKKIDGKIFMQSVLKVHTENENYFINILSDFTDIKERSDTLWGIYGIVVFSISAVSGSLLYMLTRKVTQPLNELSAAAKDIAGGNYGKTVNIKSKDTEIADLSESFNLMSSVIEDKISEIKRDAESRDIFVSNFTHELKTPMTAIMGYAEMLNSYDLEEAEKRQAANAIYLECKRIEKISSQMLNLFILKNEAPELKAISASALEKKLTATLKFLSDKYGVGFKTALPKAYVLADTQLLLSLIYNLADNAFKASQKGDEISIYGTKTDSRLIICVTDSGCGISEEHLSRLTEPFYREDKARSRKLGGAGLGLSLCKEIALIHNTELIFKSKKGVGTTVSFELLLAGGENDE